MKTPLLVGFLCFSIIATAQNVGIGTLTPAEKLHVNGNIKMDTAKMNVLKITTNAGIGKLLTSDANGNAGWMPAPGMLIPYNGLFLKNDSLNFGGRLYANTNLSLATNNLQFSEIGNSIVSIAASVPSGSNIGLNTGTVTQTFTPAITCKLSEVQLNITALNGGSITVKIKDDKGAELGTVTKNYAVLTNGLDPFAFNIYVDKTRVYQLSVTGNSSAFLNYDLLSNAYPQGDCSIGANADLAFNILGFGEETLLAFTNNRIGIGTNSPSEKLEVSGNIKANNLIATSGIQLINNAGPGKILTSGPNGVGNWADPNITPGYVVQSGSFHGFAGNAVPVATGTWEFLGPTTTLTLNGNQRVIINAVAVLGRIADGNESFQLDIGYQLQPAGAGPVTDAPGAAFTVTKPFLAANNQLHFSANGSFKIAAGTYKIGCVILSGTAGYLNHNDFVQATYMIVNE